MADLDFSFMDELSKTAPATRSHEHEIKKEEAQREYQEAQETRSEREAANKKSEEYQKKALKLARQGKDMYKIIEALAIGIKKMTGAEDWYNELQATLVALYGVGQNKPGPLLHEISRLKTSVGILGKKLGREDVPEWDKSRIGDEMRYQREILKQREAELEALGQRRIEDSIQTIDQLRADADKIQAELEQDTGSSLDELRKRLPQEKKPKKAPDDDENAAQDAEPIPKVEEYSLLDENDQENDDIEREFPF